MDGNYDIFISYRRDGGYETARIIYERLRGLGYRIFFDVETLRSGRFNTELYSKIEGCRDFIVVLAPGSLDRCQKEGDWLRLEIAHAIRNEKNVVPVMTRGFDMPAQNTLPPDIAELVVYNGPEASHRYFDAFLDLLLKFLKSTPRPALPPVVERGSATLAGIARIFVAENRGKWDEKQSLEFMVQVYQHAEHAGLSPDKIKAALEAEKRAWFEAQSPRTGRITFVEAPKLHITTEPEGARIEVDGEYAGESPVSVELPTGEHRVCARMAGCKTWERRVHFDGAGDADLPIALEKLPMPKVYTAANVSECKVPVEASDTATKHSVGDTMIMQLPGGVPLEMVWIPAGSFMMGSPETEQDRNDDEGPQRKVTLNGFWMGKYQLTKRQWTSVMGTMPWLGKEYVLDDPDSPAVWVSWNDAQAFIKKLNVQSGRIFRLPSEAEWEYACRACRSTRYYWGDDLDEREISKYAWWNDNTFNIGEDYTHVVGQKLPNEWGLYDMSGNVWEWCQDHYYDDYTGVPTDGSAWEGGSAHRMLRGGSYSDSATACRSAYRGYNDPDSRNDGFGLRLVLTP